MAYKRKRQNAFNGNPNKRGKSMGAFHKRRSVGVVSIAAARKAMQAIQELKGVDTATDITSVIATTSTNANIFTLNLVAPGSASYNRIGRKLSLKSVRLYGLIKATIAEQATTADLHGLLVRLTVVWDKQPSGVLPVFSDIFGQTLQDGTEQSSFLDKLRYDNTDRFQVLRDVVHDFDPTLYNGGAGTANGQLPVTFYDEYIPLKGKESVFSGQSGTATIADISSGALYLVVRSSNNISGVAEAQLDGTARLRYTDN